MTFCISIESLNAILSLAVFFGFVSKQKTRKLLKENKTWIFVLIILVLIGAIKVKMNCP